MKKFFSIISIILCLLVASCNDVADEPIVMDSSEEAFSSKNEQNLVTRSKSVLSTTEDLEDIVVSGYTSVENGKSMKLLFDSQLASLTGLQSGSIYVTRYETCKKDIALNGASFFEDENYNECGLRRYQDLDGGHLSYTERGYNTIKVSGNKVTLETHLIHVISDMSGRSLNIYYPCSPSNIKWHFYLYK